MARVTVEDCVSKVPNRFELVLLSAERARELASGALPTVARDNDKTSVIALREIADETVSVDDLRKRFLLTLRHNTYGFSQGETHDQELEQAIDSEASSRLEKEEAFAESEQWEESLESLSRDDEDDFSDEEEDGEDSFKEEEEDFGDKV